jgi:hypothetical protein
MGDIKNFSMKHLGDLLVVTLFTVFLIVLFHMIISPLLVTILPTVFTAKLTVTDTLLFVLLVTLISKK